MADLSKLNAAVQQLSADVDKLIAADTTTVQPAIDAATTAVQAVDAKVVAAIPPAA
jgi:outer membrane murein-binding lipoprotein Lpp